MKQTTQLVILLLFVLTAISVVQGSLHGHLICTLTSQGRIEKQRLAFVPFEEAENSAEDETRVAFIGQRVSELPVPATHSTTQKRRRACVDVTSGGDKNAKEVRAQPAGEKTAATSTRSRRKVRSERRFTGRPGAVGEYMMLNTGY